MHRILITGGTGFLGRFLAEELIRSDLGEVHILARAEKPHPLGAVLHLGDVANEEDVRNIMASVKPQWVFHLAADTRRSRERKIYQELHRVNVVGTKNLLEASDIFSAEAFVAVGTFEEYGPVETPFMENQEIRPVSPYGLTKARASKLVQDFGNFIFPATVLRLPVLYGPLPRKDTFMGILLEKISRGEKMPLASGREGRDFLHVADAVRALILAAKEITSCGGEIVNICSGREISLLAVVEIVENILGTSDLGAVGSFPERENELFHYVGSKEKAKKLLGWEPRISLEEGLREMLLPCRRSP